MMNDNTENSQYLLSGSTTEMTRWQT